MKDWARRTLAWFRGEGTWIGRPLVGLLLVAGVVLVIPWAIGRPTISWPFASARVIAARAGVVTLGTLIGQLVVPWLVDRLRALFKAGAPEFSEPENRSPQRILGALENVAYPWLMFDAGDEAASTILAGWLASKAFGTWRGWGSAEPPPNGNANPPTAPAGLPPLPARIPSMAVAVSADDAHRGRRRLYAFLVANAIQLALGAGVRALMTLIN